MKTSLLAFILLSSSLSIASCLSDQELETINKLDPSQAQEFLINVVELKADKTCTLAEGIDFDTIKENIESLNKGSK